MSAFRQIWELRYAGKVEEARSLAKGLSPFSALERSELLLLEASVLRHQKNLADSNRLVAQARELLSGAGIEHSFQLLMQEAINLDVQSKFAESMRLYQHARALAANGFEQTLATVNLAIARYNLSLPFASLLEDLGPLDSHPLGETLEQLKIVSLKQSFAQGRPGESLAFRFSPASQGVYLQAWIESLPFVASDGAHRARFRELALSPASYFQKSYRLQTIEANPRLREEPASETPAQERADRLYLWIWRWLADPTAFPVALLEEELARFPFDSAHLSLTDEDFALLRSAGAWLGLFDPALDGRFRAWREKYFPKLAPSPFFDLELACIEAIAAGDSARIDALEKQHALPAFFALVRKIYASRHGRAEAAPGTLLVRLSDHSLLRGGEKTESEPVATLLARLAREGSVSFPEAALACFGLHRFDPLDHTPRLQNLLSRAKKLLPAASALRTKSQRIYLDGKEAVRVLEGSAHERSLPRFEWPELDRKQSVGLEKKQGVELKALLLTELSGRKEFSRAEMQTRLKLPKATANRLLLGWTREGFLRAKGAGAARVYEIS